MRFYGPEAESEEISVLHGELGMAVGASVAQFPSILWNSTQGNDGHSTRKAVQGPASMKSMELNKLNALRPCRTTQSLRQANALCTSRGRCLSGVRHGPGRPSLHVPGAGE